MLYPQQMKHEARDETDMLLYTFACRWEFLQIKLELLIMVDFVPQIIKTVQLAFW